MNKKTYDVIRITTAAVLGGIVSISIARSNYIIPLIAMATAFAIIISMKKKVTGVIDDERDYHVAGNAARWTVSIFAILSAVGSIFLMSMRNSDPAYELLGSTLAYSACFVLFLQSALFYYFANKSDGKIKTDDKN
jgi:uncharacterized membrane protein